MKIRNGYVSNSSSSSFCLYGIELSSEDFFKFVGINTEDEDGDYDIYDEAENLFSKAKDLEKGLSYAVNRDYIIIGKSPNLIKDDETGKEFKETVKKGINTLFGREFEDKSFGWQEDVIENY